MNQYWIIAFILLLAGVGFIGERYGENRITVQCDRDVISAQTHVIGQIETQGKITQGAENAYQNSLNAIDHLYSSIGLPAAPGSSVRPVPIPTCGVQTSKRYRLTLKQCDQEEAKCNALWNWARDQAAVK